MKQNKRWMKSAAILLLAAAVMTAVCPSSHLAVRAASYRERYEELEKQLDVLDTALDKLKKKTDSVDDQRETLQQQIDILTEQIDLLSEQIDAQEEAVVQKHDEVLSKRQEMRESDALLRKRIRSMYMMRNDGILNTVLGATSYAEALTAADTLQRITQADTALLEKLQQQKQDLETEETEMQSMLETLQENQDDMLLKQEALNNNMTAVRSTLIALTEQESAAQEEYDRLFQSYQAAKKAAEEEFRKKSEKITEYVGGTFEWPVPGFSTISSGFGNRYLFGKQEFHTGVDITGTYSGEIYGADIVAANSGYVTVARTVDNGGYGICVYVDHGGGYITRYGHCSSLAVAAGDYVEKGQTIAYAGNSGNSTGPHLHFEIRLDGTAINPMQFFTAG